MDKRLIFEATLGSMIADFSKFILRADMSDIRLLWFETNSVLDFSTENSSLSIDSTLSLENWSIDGHFEPRRMYLLRLSVDCKNVSFCILVFTCLAGKLNLHALLNETALFGIDFAGLLLRFGVDVTLITVIVSNGLALRLVSESVKTFLLSSLYFCEMRAVGFHRATSDCKKMTNSIQVVKSEMSFCLHQDKDISNDQ
jgi:hypothetical protein